MSDNLRIYDLLLEHGKTLSRIDQSQRDLKERLFGGEGVPGAIHFLGNEIEKTNVIVARHEKKISFWRGGAAVLAFLWSAGVATASVIWTRHK